MENLKRHSQIRPHTSPFYKVECKRTPANLPYDRQPQPLFAPCRGRIHCDIEMFLIWLDRLKNCYGLVRPYSSHRHPLPAKSLLIYYFHGQVLRVWSIEGREGCLIQRLSRSLTIRRPSIIQQSTPTVRNRASFGTRRKRRA
jgi:hypothetical protein